MIMRRILRSSAALLAATAGFSVQAQTVEPTTAAVALPPGVMAPVVMREMTPAEKRAHQVWSLRAALNVAALQCQFSPFLRTVKNYNLMLPHHSAELASALKTINNHFVRLDGPQAARRTFDQYTTRTYNSFSTLDAQLSFCQKASEIGWEALAAKKGSYADLAEARLPEVRAAMIPQWNPLVLVQLGWLEAPGFTNPCLDRKGRQIPLMSKQCR
jgi:hypothetical protein